MRLNYIIGKMYYEALYDPHREKVDYESPRVKEQIILNIFMAVNEQNFTNCAENTRRS